MSELKPKEMMRRKLSGAEGGADKRSRTMLRALRLSLARAARDFCGLPLNVIGMTETTVDADVLEAQIAPDHLLLLLDPLPHDTGKASDGPSEDDAGLLHGIGAGAATLSPELVLALIQQQTTGKVDAADHDATPSARVFTGAEAAICAPLPEFLLPRAAALCDGARDRAMLAPRRFAAHAGAPRALVLELEAERFRCFNLTVELGAAAIQGALHLVLPAAPAKPPVDARPEPKANAAEIVGSLTVELTAILCRLPVSYEKLSALKPGDLLSLPVGQRPEAELVARDGIARARGQLGQLGGVRAVRFGELSQRKSPKETAGFEVSAPLPGDLNAQSEPSTAEPGEMPDREPTTATAPGGEGIPPDPGSAEPLTDSLPDLPPLDFYDDSGPLATVEEITRLAGLEDDKGDP